MRSVSWGNLRMRRRGNGAYRSGGSAAKVCGDEVALRREDGRYTDVWAEGQYAVLGTVDSGVAIFDVSAGIQQIGTYAPAGHADFQDVKLVNEIGYFSGATGTDVVDLSNPAAPTRLSRIDASVGGFPSSRNVAVGGGLLYQASEASSQIRVFNVANPSAPTLIRTIDTHDAGGIFDVTLIGDRLYAAGLGGAAYLYNVANVATQPPPLAGAVSSGQNTSSAWPTGSGNTMLVTHRQLGGKLSAWDVSSPSAASLVQSVDPSDLGFSSYSTSEVKVVGSFAYVAWYQGGLEVIDLDQLSTTGMQRAGFYVVCCSSVQEEYSGARSVFPFLGPDRVLFSDVRNGIYMVDATAAVGLQGDYDRNGTVGASDYQLWKSKFGTSELAPDGNSDGLVNAADYTIWRDAFRLPGAGVSSAIPEPCGGVLLLLGAIYLQRLKRSTLTELRRTS